MKTNTLIRQALIFSKRAHIGQKRKYTGEPYFNHCLEVAKIVDSIGGTPDMVAAALLHDTVEDTHVTHREIMNAFGPKVHDHVFYLSDLSRPENGNRKARKAIDRKHIASAPPDTKTIKIADLLSNTASITTHDPDFAKVYMIEKFLLLDITILGPGNAKLFKQARRIVADYFSSQGIEVNFQSMLLQNKTDQSV